jgi:hypothetical protein
MTTYCIKAKDGSDVVFYTKQIDAIQRTMTHGMSGDLYACVIEFDDSSSKDSVNYMYAFRISDEKPVDLDLKNGNENNWYKIINTKNFNDYFNVSAAESVFLDEIGILGYLNEVIYGTL